jgi:phosphoglycolate phosphatase-like HAD superfamily hydrolase
MFFIFDLDGTLCDISHRLHFIKDKKNADWDAFHAACVDDVPKMDIINLFDCLNNIYHHPRMEIWSGRSDTVRDQTLEWLGRHDLDLCLARMRPAGDYTPDDQLKRRWLHEELAKGQRPDVVFDDRQRVVDMWRAEGISCCQVEAWEE